EVGVDHHDALDHRREADGADAVQLVGDEAVELLRQFDLLLGADGLGLLDDLHDAGDLGGRLDAAFTVGGVPGARLDGEDRGRIAAGVDLGVAREGETAGVFVPDLDDQLVGVAHGEVRGAFADLDVGG